MARRHGFYSYYSDFEPTRPIATEEGIKARSQHGAFGKNWWAARWIEAMERLVDAGRLTRGRRYARRGQVLSITETTDGIAARVQGSQPRPYQITIQVKPLTDAQWERVIDALAEQALFTAQLLAGEMPQEIEKAFNAAGVSLFPEKRGDLTSDCSCPDYANPCKHVAATPYILGERFDEDPFLLFRLRGRTQEQVLAALRQRRAGLELFEEEEEEPPPEAETPLAADQAGFWTLGGALDAFQVDLRLPAAAMPVLKRLGEPPFAPDFEFQSLLGPAYQAMSQAALALALGGDGEEEDQ